MHSRHPQETAPLLAAGLVSSSATLVAPTEGHLQAGAALPSTAAAQHSETATTAQKGSVAFDQQRLHDGHRARAVEFDEGEEKVHLLPSPLARSVASHASLVGNDTRVATHVHGPLVHACESDPGQNQQYATPPSCSTGGSTAGKPTPEMPPPFPVAPPLGLAPPLKDPYGPYEEFSLPTHPPATMSMTALCQDGHGDEECGAVSGEERTCRICFESRSYFGNPLISPCLCAGSSQYVHRHCLRKWRESSLQNPGSQAFYRCEVCHFEYRFSRYTAARFLSHPLAVALMFASALLLLALLVGFIPLIQAFVRMGYAAGGATDTWQPPTSRGPAILLHLCNGLIILGWLGAIAWLVIEVRAKRNPCSPRNLQDSCFNCENNQVLAACCDGCCNSLSTVNCSCSCSSGDEGCGVCLLLLVVVGGVLAIGVAAFGLFVIIPVVFVWMYARFSYLSQHSAHMIENIRHEASDRQQWHNRSHGFWVPLDGGPGHPESPSQGFKSDKATKAADMPAANK